MTQPTTLPPRYLRTSEAARFLSLSPRTLEKHRTYGTGPLYRKIGGRVIYGVGDLQDWVDRGAQSSTTDPGAGAVRPAKRDAGSASKSTLGGPRHDGTSRGAAGQGLGPR